MWETRWQGLGKGLSQKDCPVWKVRQSLVPPLREEPSSRSACYGRRPPAGSAAGRCALQGHRQPKGPSSNFPSHRAPSRARDRSRGWPGHRTAGTGSARHWGRGKKEPGKSAGRSDGAGRGILRSSAPDEGSQSSSYLTPNPRMSLQDDGKGRGCVPCWYLGCRGGEQQRRAAAGEAQTRGKGKKKKTNISQRLNAAQGFRGVKIALR